jgi:hypothetical protein
LERVVMSLLLLAYPIVKLHDALYAGQLFPHHALHVDFTPHIEVGNSSDLHVCMSA